MPRLLPTLSLLPVLLGAVPALLSVTGPAAAVPPAAEEAGTPRAAPSVSRDTLEPGRAAPRAYLTDAAVPDTVAILPAPPRSHTPEEEADRATFNTTRALKGSPRWQMATADVAEGASAVLDTFACVLGTRLDEAKVPALVNLLERSRLDIAHATRGPKVHYRRLRPFVGNEAPICVQRTQALADSFSYPSGHASQGWTYALIMAALVPEKATAILTRGRAYGESRVICGVHWRSDVGAGRTNGAAIFATLLGDTTFRADLERARADVAKARSAPSPVDGAACAREESILKEPAL